MIRKTFLALAITCCCASVVTADLETNGGFETGDTSGWVSFPTANSTFTVTADANSGNWAGEVFNDDLAAGAVIKQANIGIGQVNPGDLIDITFFAKGEFANGGVAIAEFFSELSGGGTSSSEILGGAPLALTSDYQEFNFQVVAGSDVSGGVTLQFVAATGGAQGSLANLFVDDVRISRAIPEPATIGLLAVAGLGFVVRRRR